MKSTLRLLLILTFVLATASIQAIADGTPVPTCDPYQTAHCKLPQSLWILVR